MKMQFILKFQKGFLLESHPKSSLYLGQLNIKCSRLLLSDIRQPWFHFLTFNTTSPSAFWKISSFQWWGGTFHSKAIFPLKVVLQCRTVKTPSFFHWIPYEIWYLLLTHLIYIPASAFLRGSLNHTKFVSSSYIIVHIHYKIKYFQGKRWLYH